MLISLTLREGRRMLVNTDFITTVTPELEGSCVGMAMSAVGGNNTSVFQESVADITKLLNCPVLDSADRVPLS